MIFKFIQVPIFYILFFLCYCYILNTAYLLILIIICFFVIQAYNFIIFSITGLKHLFLHYFISNGHVIYHSLRTQSRQIQTVYSTHLFHVSLSQWVIKVCSVYTSHHSGFISGSFYFLFNLQLVNRQEQPKTTIVLHTTISNRAL